MNSAVRGEHLIFPCHAWVAEEKGVGYADKELYPKQPGEFTSCFNELSRDAYVELFWPRVKFFFKLKET